uniref:Major facilitator superfamily (MFS) profile domain-containing protein n=1 Tax=Globisporangium ultimum (strain ATCC 200006 / CBS 805.95 / DAOM BR144) TaxID=431595 RepID=K3WMN7_GLOUD
MKQGSSSSGFVQVVTPVSHAGPSTFTIREDSAAPRALFQTPAALYVSVFVAFMLPFQYGWSLSQLNLSTFASQPDCDARPVVQGTCLMFPGHSKAEWAYVVNAWIVGGMVGSLSCGSLADRYGRRKALMGSSLFMIVGAALQASASSLAVFTVGRAVAGICSGFATGLSGGYVNEISPPHLRKTLSVGVQLGVASAHCLSLFKDAGISDDRIGSVIINAMNLLPTLATGYLVTRFGYRKIVLFGFLGMFASGIGITIAFLVNIAELSIVFTGTYVGSFAVSVGPLIYAVMADLFPDSVRATAVSICVFFNYASNLVVGVSFPYLSDALNDFSFIPFVTVVAFFYLFTFAMIPETSGKTNEEIQAEFRARREQKLQFRSWVLSLWE